MLDRKPRLPVLTGLACIACVAIFLGINLTSHADAGTLRNWGLYTGEDLYRGAYWSLVTSAFVHIEPIHLLFNLYWLWVLGSAFELRFGPFAWLAFVLGSAFVSSGVELLSGDTGIGMSGVGYALFGFGWLTRNRLPEFARIVHDKTVLMFVFWGILCIVATYMGAMRVANLAHGAGFVFGAGLGMAYASAEGRALPVIGLIVLTALSVVPVLYNPRSSDWLSVRAAKAFDRKDWPEAAENYRKIIDMGGDTAWAQYNLALVYGYEGNTKLFKAALEDLRRVRPEDAKELEETFLEPTKPPKP